MNVLVYGGWFGSRNLGDEAILIGVKNIINEHIPEAEITALSTDPDYTERTCGVEAVKLESPRSLMRNRKVYLDMFKEADACIVTGGTPFYDYGHLSRIIHLGLPAINDKKLICFGVGSKPITSLKGREITRRLLMHSIRISTRDQLSKDILRGVLRLNSLNKMRVPPINVTGDSALFLDPGLTSQGRGDTVLFCPRRLMRENKVLFHEKIDTSSINRVRHMQAIAADELVDRGYEVKFVPFHTIKPDDDREEIRVIRNLMKNKDVEVASRPESPLDGLRMLSDAALVVGLRLHSLVLASSCGTPFTTIGYDIKISGFMDNMNVSRFNCSLDEGLKALSEASTEALENRKKVSKGIINGTRAIRKLITTEAEYMGKTVRKLADPTEQNMNHRDNGNKRQIEV